MDETRLSPGVPSIVQSDGRKPVFAALHLSRTQLAIILEGIADGVTVLNRNGQLIYANDVAARIVGYPNAQALLATPVPDIMRKFETYDELGQPLPYEELPGHYSLRGLQTSPKVIRFRVVETGEVRWSVVTSQPVFDEAGHVELAVNIFHEITDLKRTELNQRILAQAGTLLAAPLDYETRLRNVAHLAVPDMADWCAIDVLGADGSLQRLAVAHIDPAKVELAHEIHQRYPPHLDDQGGIYTVLRTGQPQLYTDFSDALLATAVPDPDELALIRQLGLKSAMIVPMVARGRTFGVITFVWAESGRRYGLNDLAQAEELAQRAALAMDNALVYAEAQQLNTALERRVADRTAQLETANIRLINEIDERRQAEEQVHLLNAELEQRVAERTAQLERLNRDLKNEITGRQQTSRALRAALKRTRELYRISQAISMVRTPDEVLQALLSSSHFKLASRASIAIFDMPWLDDHVPPQRCEILAAWNKDADLPTFTGERLTLAEYGLVPPYTRDKPIVIEDVRTQRGYPEDARRRFEAWMTRSLIIFPLIAGGNWYGMLALHFKLRHAIDTDNLRHLRGLVDETAIAIDNIRLLAAEAQARWEAERANALKLKFLAMISHELRTPLTSIKGFATTLLADDVQWHPSSQRDFLETINQEADKLAELIGQLLDLSRLEAGILSIVPKPQTLDKVLATAMAQLQIVTVDHHLVLDVPHDLPLINVDAERIAQVLTNLVGNAAKYSPPQTRIAIAAHRVGNVIQIDVADEGPGIPPSERVRIFEPFQQIETHTINRTKGAGLGLAICKGVVEAHGGRIWMQDRPMPGTVMSFTLPIGAAAK